MTRGKLIVFEGGEGSGKTTLSAALANFLQENGREVVLTKEPGGGDNLCVAIRQMLLDPANEGKMDLRAEFLLFEADRAQHVGKTILPALENGQIVISDRFEGSTFAYQCAAQKVCEWHEFQQINNFAKYDLKPDFVFWVDVEPSVGLARNVASGKKDRFEEKDVSFHKGVREGFAKYFELMADEGQWMGLDGGLSLAELEKQVIAKAKELLK